MKKTALSTALVAIALAAPAFAQQGNTAATPNTAKPVAKGNAACKACGTITDVKEVRKEGEGSGAGAVVGGVLGGVLGHQIGSGRGNTAATVVGAGAGAYAGHQVEKNQKSTVSYQVVIKMEEGKNRYFDFKERPSWRVGDEVEIVDGKMTRPKK